MGRLREAWDAIRGHKLPSSIEGEVAYADPFRLLPMSGFMQYNPSELIGSKGYRVIDKMRRDEQIKAALAFKKHAVLSTGWEVSAPEDGDEAQAEFINEVFTLLPGTFETVIFEIMSAIEYGFSVSEKVYAEREGRVVLSAIKTRDPRWFGFDQDEYGNDRCCHARNP